MKRALLAAVMGFTALTAAAQVDEIYDPAPPANAAFVRVINAAPSVAAVTAKVGKVRVGNKPVAAGSASPYAVVEQGKRILTLAAGKWKLEEPFEVKAGYFYTIAFLPEPSTPRLVVLEDTVNSNLAKAQIALYNLSAASNVELKTTDLKTTVIPAVASPQTKSIKVNPIRKAFAVLADGAAVYTVPEVQMQAASSYSVIVTGPAAKPNVIWILNTTGKGR